MGNEVVFGRGPAINIYTNGGYFLPNAPCLASYVQAPPLTVIKADVKQETKS